jgi:hypothetical protein
MYPVTVGLRVVAVGCATIMCEQPSQIKLYHYQSMNPFLKAQSTILRFVGMLEYTVYVHVSSHAARKQTTLKNDIDFRR